MSNKNNLLIALGADHAGFEMKEQLKQFFQQEGYTVRDFGTHSAESVDYPDFAHPVANAVESKEATLGVLVCGSGNGVAMAANKHQGIRAALCWNRELASMARKHNDANILCIPARYIDVETAREISAAFLNDTFDGGRHQNRVNKIVQC
jgi:ribose 5-phosphate isomerase B